MLYASEAILLIKSQLQDLNNCINRALYKIFGVTGAEAVKDVRNFIALDDVAVLVERRTVKLIDSNSYGKLFFMLGLTFVVFSECMFVCVCICVYDCC